jgi:hypothetical protein
MARSRTALAVALTSLVVLVALAGPAAAHPGVPLGPTVPTDLTFAATDNISYLGRFPEHTGTAGGRLSDDGTRFYVTDPRGVYVYDTTDARSPDLLASLPLYQTGTGAALSQEDVDTDGRVLLVDAAPTPNGTARLTVVDVATPEDGLQVLGTVATTDHTWTCVTGTFDDGRTGCAYAYGRTGHIIDLTDPTRPVNLEKTWREQVDYGGRSNPAAMYTHDLTEIRPGLVMSAGRQAILMDTTDPARPTLLTRIVQDGRFGTFGYHSAEWADGGRAPHLVLGTEIAPSPNGLGGATTENTAGTDCEGPNSVIETWDARAVVAELAAREPGDTGPLTATFTKIDDFDAGGRGIFLQGQAPGHVLYCAHWMDLHPAYGADGGHIAVSYYDRGTRFLRAGADGVMEEVGWITALESYSGSARWITDEVVYVMDYRRGLEVIEIDLDREAAGTYESAGTLVALTSTFSAAPDLHVESLAGPAALVLLAGLVLAERRRARGARPTAAR